MHAEYPHNQFCCRLKYPNLLGSLVWASGLIPLDCIYLRPLQQHFHSLGLTNWFTPPRRLDPLVLANYPGNGRTCLFLPLPRVGVQRRWISRFKFRLQALNQHFIGAQAVILVLHHWVSVFWVHQLMTLHYSCSLYQQTEWELPIP